MSRLIVKLVSLTFLTLFLANTVLFSISPSAAAPANPLYFKWKTYLGPKAGTYIAPLAADLNGDGKMEIVVTGGTMDYGTDGTVSALDGKTGNIIWQVSPGGIGMHTPFEVADINNDGIKEIVIGAQGGALVLYGNNGSTYWRNTNAPAEENYPAVADVNNDGYDEIFVTRGYGPINGIDYTTELTYDGRIIAQAPTWHPCWGGATIGDPYSNGTYILYEGDRGLDYNPSEDNYKYGGWGLRALDAVTLTPLWNDSDILCSSHAPMLADVDKTGHLEVIAAWQGNGLVVKDAMTGAVDTTGGIYRKAASLGLPSHSQPTVGDFDGNGDMEIMLSRASNPIIWDLYTWQQVATLPIITQEPPKVGNVTGSALGMDIVAVTGLSTYTTIFSYNNTSHQFAPVQNITISNDLPNGTLNANAFSLIQDVDRDGYNELLLTTSTGWVYCFGTAGTTTPPARTGFQFFSERKNGVAQYVPPPGPLAPQISQPSPTDGATGVQVSLSQLNFKLTISQGNLMNYSVTTSPNIGNVSKTGVVSGSYSLPISHPQYGTTYNWTVTATAGQNVSSKTFSFTTQSAAPAPSWWNANWQYRRKITIDHTRIGSTQTNFPMLIDITYNKFSTEAQTNGNDFVFTDVNGTKLSHEIESYDGPSGHLTAWVRIPFLSSSQDTILYVYYGNPSATNQQSATTVWDTNYMMVQHLDEKSGMHFDSTVNANNGVPIGGVVQGVSGKIDGADTFDGSSGYVQVPDSNTLAGYTQGFTVSFWFKMNDATRRQTILNKFAQSSPTQMSWFVEYSPSTGLGFFASSDGATYSQWHAVFAPSPGTWYYGTVMWSANSVPIFYINGNQLPTVGTAKIPAIYSNAGIPLVIGKSGYTTGREYNGTLDEVRISNIARTASYIQACYNVEGNPTTVYLLGSEEVSNALAGPVLTNPSPQNNAVGTNLNPVLSITAQDQAGPMNITFSSNVTGTWLQLRSFPNVGNGFYSQNVTNMNKYNTTYYWRVNATDGTNSTSNTYSFTTKAWWNTTWQYRRMIVIDHTKVQADQTNFPLLIDLNDSTLTSKAQPNGNDFVFTDVNQTKLSHEIESYDGPSGHLTAWVRIPFLSSSQDTILYVYYGNPSATNQQSATTVWDTNYMMVQHLKESGGIRNDSTGNGYGSTVNGNVTKTTGVIDGADVLDGANSNLRQSSMTLAGKNEIMIESWVYINSIPNVAGFAKTDMYGRNLSAPLYWYGLWMGISNTSPISSFTMTIRLFNPSGTGSTYSFSYSVSLLDQWVHVGLGLSKLTNKTYFYVNGVLVKSDDISSLLGSGFITPMDDPQVKGFSVGSNILGGEFLKMKSDEVRISNMVRSSSWVAADYYSEKAPFSFYNLQMEESSGAL